MANYWWMLSFASSDTERTEGGKRPNPSHFYCSRRFSVSRISMHSTAEPGHSSDELKVGSNKFRLRPYDRDDPRCNTLLPGQAVVDESFARVSSSSILSVDE